MRTIALELRDRGTFIPIFATSMKPANGDQNYLLRRAGYDTSPGAETFILLGRLDGGHQKCCYDPYDWNDRTWETAHHYIMQNFAKLNDGDVIDVEFILKETPTKKTSERMQIPL